MCQQDASSGRIRSSSKRARRPSSSKLPFCGDAGSSGSGGGAGRGATAGSSSASGAAATAAAATAAPSSARASYSGTHSRPVAVQSSHTLSITMHCGPTYIIDVARRVQTNTESGFSRRIRQHPTQLGGWEWDDHRVWQSYDPTVSKQIEDLYAQYCGLDGSLGDVHSHWQPSQRDWEIFEVCTTAPSASPCLSCPLPSQFSLRVRSNQLRKLNLRSHIILYCRRPPLISLTYYILYMQKSFFWFHTPSHRIYYIHMHSGAY